MRFSICFAAVACLAQNVVWDKDVEYSRVGERVAMDIARPASGSARPAVLAIHGGGFRAGKRDSYLPLVEKLAQRGYVAATTSYRLSPRHQFPAAVEDVKAAVRFLRANAGKYGIDPDRICTVGGSAGGHLALMLGLTAGVREFEGSGPNLDRSSKVSCVVDYYGPTDFTKSYGKSVDAAEVLPMFLGGDLEHARPIHQRSSPLNWATANAAPVLAIHGTKDRYVAYEQSVWLIDRLRQVGVDAELLGLQDADHGFKGADAVKAENAMFAWFDKYLAPKKTRRILISDHGPAGEVILMDWPTGKIHWKVPNKRGHDAQWLGNGNVLYTIGADKRVVEIDSSQKEVWSYSEGLEHPISAERLANGNTLINDAKKGEVIEVTRDKKVVWRYASPDLANMRSRNARRTKTGTTLISVEAAGKIIEVNPSGEIVWTYQAEGGEKRRPYRGLRLDNGNTIISLTDPGELVEVDKAGKIVRSIGGNQMNVRFSWVSGTDLLPNGNLIVNDYTGRRLVELDPQWNIVNELRLGHRTVATVAAVD
ncbi:MAG: alpha/beta hydrolase fold domain-containing protein [Bryobacteraceae bacterium]